MNVRAQPNGTASVFSVLVSLPVLITRHLFYGQQRGKMLEIKIEYWLKFLKLLHLICWLFNKKVSITSSCEMLVN